MEPVSVIVGAIVAGASSALKDSASQAVKDAYSGLKALIINKWKGSSEGLELVKKEVEANYVLENLEHEPEKFKSSLEKKLHELMEDKIDEELLEKAQGLLELVGNTSASKYSVDVSNSKGVQIGDNNSQNNTFN